jgi:hypothetical protein
MTVVAVCMAKAAMNSPCRSRGYGSRTERAHALAVIGMYEIGERPAQELARRIAENSL